MINAFAVILFILLVGTALYMAVGTVGRYVKGLFGNYFVTSEGMILELINCGFFNKNSKLSRYENKRLSKYIRKCSKLPGFNEALEKHRIRALNETEARVMGIRLTHTNYLLHLNNFIGY